MEREEILKAIEEKYDKLGVPVDAMLEGLLWSTPITYWDYIQTDALLGLQTPRTTQPDEMVFIMYHQVNELLFKMILWEIDQVAKTIEVSADKFTMHLNRISRYFDMLSTSFSVMADGMEKEQYLKFRNTLTPASGFQSAQYRKIEFASTELINLIDARYRDSIDRNSSFKNAYNHLYWQAAGKNYTTGQKSTLLNLFEKKYMGDFIDFMEDYNTINLSLKFKQLPKDIQLNPQLIKAMRHYDYTVNVKWVLAHYNAAGKYLGGKEKDLEAKALGYNLNFAEPGNIKVRNGFTEVLDAATGFMCIKKEVFYKVGGFDERFRIAYEDIDFAHRIHKGGFKTKFIKDASACHPWRTLKIEGNNWKPRGFELSELKLFIKKHPDAKNHNSPQVYLRHLIRMLSMDMIKCLLIFKARGLGVLLNQIVTTTLALFITLQLKFDN